MRLFFRLIGYVRPYWRRLTAALVCMVLFAVLSTVSLGMILPFMNVLFSGQTLVADGEAGAAAGVEALASSLPSDLTAVDSLKAVLKERMLDFFASGSASEALGKICIGFLVLFFAKSLFGYFQTFLMVTVEQRVIRDIRNALFAHLNELSLSFFHGQRTGQLISRITNDVVLVRKALVATFANLFRETLLATLYLGLAVWISWKLALTTFVVLPPIVILMAVVGRRLRKRSARLQERMADITSTLEESIAGVRVVKAFGMEDYENKRFFKHTFDYFRTSLRLEVLSAMAGPLVEYLGVVGVVIILWYGGREVVLGGEVTPDWFLLFLGSVLSALQPLRKVSRANNDLQIGLAAGRRVFDILDTEPTVVGPRDGKVLESLDDGIVYENVSFSYDTGDEVLHDVNLAVSRGEVVAIVGPSGAGKSTLLDLLARFYDPTDGRVAVDGTDLREVDLKSLRRLLGIVTQETILFNDTVRNNIAYGLAGALDEDVAAAARAANAHGFISEMPEGYDTEIGERGVMLSGGERQRIAIARAILKNPPILILDEATSSLDTESERLVQEAIERLLEGRTVLVIAHRLSTVRNADRIVVLDDGAVKESGTHEELMSLGGLYRYLYDMQFASDQAGRPGEPPSGE
ncbi:MAG TPA: ABC transporter ATP-binding protein [bacterium]|nr:ABC transporter ATP-binding protein [bacterium]